MFNINITKNKTTWNTKQDIKGEVGRSKRKKIVEKVI